MADAAGPAADLLEKLHREHTDRDVRLLALLA